MKTIPHLNRRPKRAFFLIEPGKWSPQDPKRPKYPLYVRLSSKNEKAALGISPKGCFGLMYPR
jgi:hypothetical protein